MMVKKKRKVKIVIRKDVLIKRPKSYGLKELKKNISSTLKHYETEGLIPKPFKLGLGRGRSVVLLYLAETTAILRFIINMKKNGFRLDTIRKESKKKFLNYIVIMDIYSILNNVKLRKYDVAHSYLDLNLDQDEIEYFFHWVENRYAILREYDGASEMDNIEGFKLEDSEYVQKYLSRIFKELMVVLHSYSGLEKWIIKNKSEERMLFRQLN